MDKECFDKNKETMSPEERAGYFAGKIRETIQYAYENAPFMKRHMDKAGVKPGEIMGPKDLAKLPVIKKEQVREAQKASPPFGGLLGVPPEELQRVYLSPGPIYDAECRGERRLKEAKALFGAGLRPTDRVMVTFSYHLVPAGLLFDTALRQFGAMVIPSGTGNTELQLTLMRDLRVTGYIGTATFLMALLTKGKEMGFTFGSDLFLKSAVLTGEKVPPSLRKIFEKEYGIRTGQVYGTADLGLFAYECPQQEGMHVCEEVFVEIVDPKTGDPVPAGETGEIVVTYFDKTLPILRYGTGDLSRFLTDPCPCGRTSLRLTEILGRVGDSFKVRGMFIHEPQVREVISKVMGVSRGVLSVTRENQRDYLTFRVEVDDESVDRAESGAALENLFREICRLKLDRVEYAPKGTIKPDQRALSDDREWE